MKQHLYGVSIANRVRLLRRDYVGAILLVEGEDDKKLYGVLVDAEACKIQIAYGKPNLSGALAILEADGFQGIVAIADADFDRLDGKSPSSPNLFWTDTHDLETMMISSPALDLMLSFLGSETKIKEMSHRWNTTVRDRLLAAAEPVGYLRWLSDREGMGLRFDDLPFERMLDGDLLTINLGKLIESLQNRSGKGALVEEALTTKMAQLQELQPDRWQLCCGHDLVAILSIALQRILGDNKPADVKADRLVVALGLAYIPHFRSTLLYAAISNWQASNSPFSVFA